MKCSVRICLKRSSGSTRPVALEGTALNSSRTRTVSSLVGRRCNPGNVLEEVEVGERGEVNAGESALRDGDVRFVPQADVGDVARDDPLDVGIQIEAPGL